MLQQDCLFPWLTILDNCLIGLKIQKELTKDKKDKVINMLKKYGLENFIYKYPNSLSGGMKQRVAIIRSLLNHTPVLLMDEPFSAVDMLNRHSLQEQLIGVWKRFESTILFVTHDVDEAVYLADKIVIMDKNPGRIQEIIEVPLERPRQRESREFLDFQDVVEKKLGVWEP